MGRAGRRPGLGPPSRSPAPGDRQAAGRARAGPRGHQPADARAGARAGRRRLAADAARAAPGRGVQRPDLPADRACRPPPVMLDGGVGLLRTMPGRNAAAVANLRAAATALGIDWPAARPRAPSSPRLDPAEAARRRVPGPGGRTAARRRLHELRRRAARRPAARLRSPRPTRMSPRRCAGWPTATPPRSASRCSTGPRCPPGYVRRCRGCRRRWPPPTGSPTRPSAARSTWSRRCCCAGRVGEEFDAAVLDGRRRAGAARRWRHRVDEPPVRARCEGGPMPLGERVRVRLVEADPSTRRVRFRADRLPSMTFDAERAARRHRADRRHPRRHRAAGARAGVPAGAGRPAGAHRLARRRARRAGGGRAGRACRRGVRRGQRRRQRVRVRRPTWSSSPCRGRATPTLLRDAGRPARRQDRGRLRQPARLRRQGAVPAAGARGQRRRSRPPRCCPTRGCARRSTT